MWPRPGRDCHLARGQRSKPAAARGSAAGPDRTAPRSSGGCGVHATPLTHQWVAPMALGTASPDRPSAEWGRLLTDVRYDQSERAAPKPATP